MWGALLGAGISAGADLLGNYQGFLLNSSAAESAMHDQYYYTKRLLNQRHQWEVSDLRKAGLNPVLSAGGTPSTSGGSAVAASVPSSNVGFNAVSSAMKAASLQTELEAVAANAVKSKADAGVSFQQSRLLSAETRLKQAQAANAEMLATNALQASTEAVLSARQGRQIKELETGQTGENRGKVYTSSGVEAGRWRNAQSEERFLRGLEQQVGQIQAQNVLLGKQADFYTSDRVADYVDSAVRAIVSGSSSAKNLRNLRGRR